MRIVVTGAGGFIGWHLVDALARRGDLVQAWMRELRTTDWPASVESIAVDIVDRAAISGALARFAPDAVVHLAAQSLPGRSWDDPALTYEVNVNGTIHLLEAVRGLTRPPRVLVAGSSAEYAEPFDDRPIAEEARVGPNSPYGSSKLACDQLVRLYFDRYGLDLVRFRPFHFVGPRKTGDVCSDFARRVVAIEQGSDGVMRVGALDVVRDLIDIRDGIGGVLCILDKGRRGDVYNVCGGKPVTIGNILEGFRRLASVSFAVVTDPGLVRPLEQKIKIGDATKLRRLGWRPAHDLDSTLCSILDYWRSMAH